MEEKNIIKVKKYSDADEDDIRYLRLAGLFAAVCSLGFVTAALANSRWIIWNEVESMGLWENCLNNLTNSVAAIDICEDKISKVQILIISTLLSTIGLTMLASGLATAGVCSSILHRKLYFFHSSAEIYIVCAMLSISSMLVYIIPIELERLRQYRSLQTSVETFDETSATPTTSASRGPPGSYAYGSAIFLVLLATFFYLVAAVAMAFDEVASALVAWLRKQHRVN